jgi:N-acetylneuraminic acid mutarotase
MFGGYGQSGTTKTYLNDTWEWDGKEWTQVEDTGPAPRSGMAMCFDSKAGRVLLFGGGNAAAQFNDTWTWDGISWTQEQDTGPPARMRHGMDYDSVRDRTVLFGGMGVAIKVIQVWVSGSWFTAGHYESQTITTSQYFNDTWEYDGSVWTRVADTGPSARHSFGFAYGGNVVSLFGGMDGSNTFRDTWQWNGVHWTQRQDMGPAARAPAGAAYDSIRGRMVVFGGAGAGGALFGDTWEAFERP